MVSLPIVLLIFISSNNPQEKPEEKLLGTTTPLPERGFADSGKPAKEYQGRVNDLTTTTAFKFPEERSRGKASGDKIIREKVVPHEENEKSKTPVPLYSLVKNECGEGYALDENGVCQKTISLRGGKTLDSDERRKRQADQWQRPDRNFFSRAHASLGTRTLAGNGFGKISSECSNLYPGLVSDGAGGCRKRGAGDSPLDKMLPP